MRNKTLLMLVALMMLALIVAPSFAWIDSTDEGPEPYDDYLWEQFGPRANKLYISLYSNEISEWETGLEQGKVDLTDWPVDEEHYEEYLSPPAEDDILVTFYGPEFGLFILDLNNNNNTALGNPPDPAYPNPVWPNPMADVNLRRAIATITDKRYIVNTYIGAGFGYPLDTMLGPEFGGYQHPEMRPGGALEYLCYLYDEARAVGYLEAAGCFPIGGDGWRFYDKNGNGVKDPGEDLVLKFFIRGDHAHRSNAGTFIAGKIESVLKIHVNKVYGTITAARQQVMADKNFHLYTGGWSLGVDPDSVILWHWDYYWHPGRPYNYAGCNNASYNEAADRVQYANTLEEAREAAWDCQVIFAENVLSVPLWSYAASKANRRRYSGGNNEAPVTPDDGENKYRGQTWEGIVNVYGYGTDGSLWTFNNMHPQGYEFGDGAMTIRYGFKTPDIRQYNPVYAEWLWDNTVLDLLSYTSLLGRNPYDLSQFIPLVAETFKVGTYTHPVYGTCSKIVFTIRDDISWSDGKPLTLADIYFTFVEIDDILAARGLPPPWWISNVQNILSFSILDAYNFEVLLDVKSVFAVGWIGGNRILPQHIWRPICESGDPTGNAPDPNLITTGPWRLAEYVANDHILLVANTPGSIVNTGLEGSQPIESPNGYFRIWPFNVYTHIYDPASLEDYNKIPYEASVKLVSDVSNYFAKYTLPTAVEIEVNETAVPGTYTEVLPAADPLPTPVSLVDFEAILKRSMYWYSKVYYDGATTLTYWEHLVITTKAGLTITWKGTPIFTAATGDVYVVDVYYYFTLPAAMPQIPDGEWILVDWDGRIWSTLAEDFTGSTWYDQCGLPSYPYKSVLPTPDYKVDIKDVGAAAKGFGSYPGHARWNTVADLNHDYKIDIKDVGAVAKKFGWIG